MHISKTMPNKPWYMWIFRIYLKNIWISKQWRGCCRLTISIDIRFVCYKNKLSGSQNVIKK